MAKGKSLSDNIESASDSNDESNSNIGHNSDKKQMNNIGLKMTSLNSITHVLNGDLGLKLTSNKLVLPLAKKRKRDVSNSSSSEEDNERTQIKKSVKRNHSNNSQKKDASEGSESDSVTHDIKREVLSDNSDLQDSVSNYRNILTNMIVKNEGHNNSGSESESDRSKVSSATTSKSCRRSNSFGESSSVRKENKGISAMQYQQPSDSDSDATTRSRVTVLQDICLTPKSKARPQERIKVVYPGLKQIDTPASLELSDSDELYLFRIPKNVDPKLLKKAKINIENECKIDLGEKYIIKLTTKIPHPTLVISANSQVLQFKNNIIMEKYVKSKKEPNVMTSEKKSVPLPENLKKRHPLFGSDFLHKIKLSEHVEQKLDQAIKNSLKREKKLKKKLEKRRSEKETESQQERNQEIFNLLNSHAFLTNNERIKREVSDDSAFGSSSSMDQVKRKNKKQKGASSGVVIKQELEMAIEPETTDEISTVQKKKKKKDRSYHKVDWPEISNIKKEIEDTDIIETESRSTSPKKDRISSSIINSTFKSEILRTPKFYPEVSTIEPEASTSTGKKSKKSKNCKEGSKEEKEKLISDLLNNVTEELNVSKSGKKKKKHKEDGDLSSTLKLEF